MKSYNNSYGRFIALVAVFIFLSSSSLLSDTGWKIITSSETALTVSYKPHLSGWDSFVTSEGNSFYLPVITGAYPAGDSRETPVVMKSVKNITIPFPEAYSLSDVKVKTVKSFNRKMLPKAALFIERDDIGSSSFDFGNSYGNYNTPEWVTIDYKGIARNRHIASLSITAARYNSKTNAIEIPSEIIVTIKFPRGKNRISPSSRSVDDRFVSTINHYETANWTVPPEKWSAISHDKKNDKLLSGESMTWLKITIDKEGIYRITDDQLSSLGAEIPKNQINTIKIMGNGGKELSENVDDAPKNIFNEQPILVKTKGDGSLSEIIFYGSSANGFEYDSESKEFHHYINHYSLYNYYLLTWGGSDGKRAAAVPPPSDAPDHKPNTYIERVFFEEELNNPFNSPSGRAWLGRTIFPAAFQTKLYDLDRSGEVFYRFSLAHSADSGEHGYFTLEESGTVLKEFEIRGIYGSYVDARSILESVSTDASVLPQDGRSSLKFSYNNPYSQTASPYFDWYEIHYPRYFNPIENSIAFWSDPEKEGITEYSINNFSGTLYGFETGDPANPVLLENLAVTGGMFILKSEEEAGNPKRYYISGSLKEPKKIEKIEYAGLRENKADTDIIVVTHPELETSAQQYADYRNEQGELSAEVFRIDHIFNEFGSGLPDPTALRDFIAYCYANWDVPPSYVLLWGDGHYDYTPRFEIMNNGSKLTYQVLVNNKVNLIPPYESIEEHLDTFDATVSYTTDDYYARIAGNDKLVDVGIGRMTIETPEEGQWIFEKIKHYENNSSIDYWRTLITLVADDSPTSDNNFDGDDHTYQSEQLAGKHIPNDMQLKKIYLPEYPAENVPNGRRKPRVTQEILTTVNTAGTILMNYLGHGNPRVWSHEEVLERDINIPQMTNLDKLFFCTAATCDFGRFDMPDLKSGAEELVLSENGGAIGVFSASRVVYAHQNASLTYKFYDLMFERNQSTGKYPRLGDIVFKVKQIAFGDNDEKFYLLGDPAMRILIPENIVRIDSINGQPAMNADSIELEALSSVKVSGAVTAPDSLNVLTDFNGITVLTLRDSEQDMEFVDIDGTIHYVTKPGGALNRGSYQVENGRFTAEFIIPKDISYSGEHGNLFAYAFNEDGFYAKGSNSAVKITGIDINAVYEDKGPEIDIFLDSRMFQKGDIVRKTPLLIVDLSDESGLNTTGLGIGHRIEAWLDDSPNSIDLTGYFNTSVENSKAGTAETYLPELAPGTHKLKVRAWDVYNNYTVGETYFRVKPDGEFEIYDILNYPNPVKEKTTFTFQHNLAPPLDAEINIFSLNGLLVDTVKGKILTAHYGALEWNCMNKKGNSLSAGPYYYSIELKSREGSQNSSGSFILIK